MKLSLRAARINGKLSVTDAAKAAGIGAESLYKYEGGKTSPKIDVLMRLCDVYGCKLDDLALDIFLPKDYEEYRNRGEDYDKVRDSVERERV